MKIFIPLLIVFAMISSCTKPCGRKTVPPQDLCATPPETMGDCITDSNQLKTLILGKWNWTQSINSWTQEKTNPCTENKYYAYEFQNNGVVKYYENDTFKSTGTFYYWANNGVKITAHDSAYTFSASGWAKLCGNYLIIDNSPVDGPKTTFLRAN